MHLPFLSAQSVLYTAYMNAINGTELSTKPVVSGDNGETFADSLKAQIDGIATNADGTSNTPNDMLYEDSKDHFKSVINSTGARKEK